jgi:hypothetical protein
MFPAFLLIAPVLMAIIGLVYVKKRRSRKASH